MLRRSEYRTRDMTVGYAGEHGAVLSGIDITDAGGVSRAADRGGAHLNVDRR
jgi:hypothetical protein